MRRQSILGVLLIVAVAGTTTGCAIGGARTASSNDPQSSTSTSNASSANSSYRASAFHVNQKVTSQWMVSEPSKKSVTLNLETPLDNLSISGYSNGFANIVIPTGWKVTVQYQNKNQVISEGLVVVNHSDISKGKSVQLAFTGAATAGYEQGIAPGGKRTFSFTASHRGQYVMESVQTGQSGTWIWFTVSSSVNSPVVKTK